MQTYLEDVVSVIQTSIKYLRFYDSHPNQQATINIRFKPEIGEITVPINAYDNFLSAVIFKSNSLSTGPIDRHIDAHKLQTYDVYRHRLR